MGVEEADREEDEAQREGRDDAQVDNARKAHDLGIGEVLELPAVPGALRGLGGEHRRRNQHPEHEHALRVLPRVVAQVRRHAVED